MGTDQIVLLAIAGVVILASLSLWTRAINQWLHHQPLLPAEPRPAVPWTILELLLIGLLGFITLQVAYVIVKRSFGLPTDLSDTRTLSAPQQITMMVTFAAASLIAWCLAMLVCRGVAKATWRDLGFSSQHLHQDLLLALAGFAMLSVPMLSRTWRCT